MNDSPDTEPATAAATNNLTHSASSYDDVFPMVDEKVYQDQIQKLIVQIETMMSEQNQNNYADLISDENYQQTITALTARIAKIKIENADLDNLFRDALNRQNQITTRIDAADNEALHMNILIKEIQRQMQCVEQSNGAVESVNEKTEQHLPSSIEQLLLNKMNSSYQSQRLSQLSPERGISHEKRVAELKEQIQLAIERRDQLARSCQEKQAAIESAQRVQQSLVSEKKMYTHEVKNLSTEHTGITNEILSIKDKLASRKNRSMNNIGTTAAAGNPTNLVEFIHSLTPELQPKRVVTNSHTSSKTANLIIEKPRTFVTDFTLQVRKVDCNSQRISSMTSLQQQIKSNIQPQKSTTTANHQAPLLEESSRLESNSISYVSEHQQFSYISPQKVKQNSTSQQVRETQQQLHYHQMYRYCLNKSQTAQVTSLQQQEEQKKQIPVATNSSFLQKHGKALLICLASATIIGAVAIVLTPSIKGEQANLK